MTNAPIDPPAPGGTGNALERFLRLESATGILLFAATVLAMVAANSFLSPLYARLLGTEFEIRLGTFSLEKPLLLLINDGLMAIFFFTVGLELKREVVEGELSDPRRLALPGLAAVGGIAVPALVYWIVNRGDEVAMRGWAVPCATDIAFALGVLALLGSRVPKSLKVFLLTLAILDDLAAIVIIALFYTSNLGVESLALAGGCLLLLLVLNLAGVRSAAVYIVVGLVLWHSVLKSGVHATLAGVALALFIPIRPRVAAEPALLHRLEHDFHPWVAFGVLPVFAFANAGVRLEGLGLSSLLEPVPLGIALGLLVGKPIGVLGGALLARATGLGRLPEGATWASLAGVGFLCGIGFTMSLFIGSLAFELGGPDIEVSDRIGILAGSGLSAIVGAALTSWAVRERPGRSAAAADGTPGT